VPLTPNTLMLLGACLWLAGELWGVWRNRRRHATLDTTSEWVWLVEWRWPLSRWLIVCLLLLLLAHFLWQVPLLPHWLLPAAAPPA